MNVRIFVLCVLAVAGAFLVWQGAPFGRQDAELRVVFFDVGQGDAVFIESPTGVQVLIDAGIGSGVLRSLGYEMGFFDREIDMVVATHPDKDHIGGLPDVFTRYKVNVVLLTENESGSNAAHAFREALEAEEVGGAARVYARAGMRFDLGGGAVLEVLYPDDDPSALPANTSSIVARVAFDNTSILLTGDAPKSVEELLVTKDKADGINHLKSNVLKVGHHGSRTSTSDIFLAWTDPDFAVISAGKDNRYGHPHEEVTAVLEKHGVFVASTADMGNIVLVSNGEEVILDH